VMLLLEMCDQFERRLAKKATFDLVPTDLQTDLGELNLQ